MATTRKDADLRAEALFRERDSSWMPHWKDLSDYLLPRRYRWLQQPNQANRGSPINQKIIDSTGSIAARTLASGMMAGITSPTRPWFKLKIEGFANDESHPVSIWLAECERRMLRIFAESNFYPSIAVVYSDLAVFGTACNLIYEDYENVITCFNPPLGEFAYGLNDKLQVDTIGRQFLMTIKQMVQKFGEERISQSARSQYATKGAAIYQERIIRHLIEPNTDKIEGIAQWFPFREMYWEQGAPEEEFLKVQGLWEWPAITPRWDVTSNDSYGRGPGMDALPDVKQLQQETKRKAQAIDKMVSPPMVGDIELKNQPMSMLPAGVTFVSRKEGVGFKPAYEVRPPIEELKGDIAEVQNRVRVIFFNDLFMMFQNLDAEPRSAAAVDARREEKLVMLGPVLERFQNEALDPAIERTFNVMKRARLIPPPPPEVQGAPIQVSYTSILAEAQRVAASAGLERYMAFIGNLAGAKPEVLDNVDQDEASAVYADYMGIPPKVILSRDAVAQVRAQRAKAQAEAKAEAASMAAVEGAKTLSQTEVGGGQNALQRMLGGGAV